MSFNNPPMACSADELANDLLEGAEAIADFLGKDVRQIYHLVGRKQLPAFKIGAVIHARRSTLKHFFAAREAEALAAGRAPAKSK
jgi:hypothetical protein